MFLSYNSRSKKKNWWCGLLKFKLYRGTLIPTQNATKDHCDMMQKINCKLSTFGISLTERFKQLKLKITKNLINLLWMRQAMEVLYATHRSYKSPIPNHKIPWEMGGKIPEWHLSFCAFELCTRYWNFKAKLYFILDGLFRWQLI